MGQRRAAMGRVRDMPTLSDKPVIIMLAAGMAKRYGGCKPLAPVGLHGEALIDVNASDALSAGFGDVVLVLGPQTGPAIEYHVEKTWPTTVVAHMARQPVPLGTAHAALCARRFVGDRPFALVNADDIYGVPALRLLADHLVSAPDHANVAYRLADTIVTGDPVTRGTCELGDDGMLRAIVERKLVRRHEDGRFTADDGREPAELDPLTLVSMNLWGLRPEIWPVLESSVVAVHPKVGPDGNVGEALASVDEVLLPEVVGDLVTGRIPGTALQAVRVLHGQGRCIGVTHADDLPVVRNELAVMIGHGQRPEGLWADQE